MPSQLPQVKHLYQNHALDSTRWDHFLARDDDIIVATPYKSGTTWMQMIVMHLIFQDLQMLPVWEFSKWLEKIGTPIEEIITHFEAQTHRRCIKTHLPLDGLKYFPQVKYIVVGRDARDVFISMWNHYSNFTDAVFNGKNNNPNRFGDPFPRPPDDIREFWRDWMTKGWFDWESEGYPFWSNMRHVQTWWDFKHLPNILFVHYNDLLNNLESEIKRIAHYLNIDLSSDMLSKIAEAVTFANVKQNATQIMPDEDKTWVDGANTFFNQGTNGRWREVLTEDDLALYHAAVQRELSPDCAQWLENGTRQKR